MKKMILPLIAASLFSNLVHADVIKCSFTEPFLSTEYSMAQQSLTITGPDIEPAIVIKNVSFQIKSAGHFELLNKDGKVLQILDLTMQGSNGMSDTVYPYDVKDMGMLGGANGGIGGCYSNYLKPVEPK